MNKPRFRAEQLLQDASSACSNYGSLDKIEGLVDPLPLFIRRHGLAVTLRYLRHRKCRPEAQDREEAEWVICQAFLLDRWLADGIPGSGSDQKIDYICCKCPTREYRFLSERAYAVFEALRAAVQAHQALRDRARSGVGASAVTPPSTSEPEKGPPILRPGRSQFIEESSSPRWLLDYGMNAFDGQAATELLIKVCKKAKDAAYSPFYEVALEEWRKNIETSPRPCVPPVELQTAVSVMVGLADTSVIEKSLHLHPLYGTPIIRGETLKGLLIDTAKRLQDPNGNKLLPAKDGAIDVVAGTSKQPGVIDVLDAWYVSDPASGEPLIMETDTVHHPKYYDSAGGIPPYDTEGPNPIRQLAVQGKFLFVVRGESEAWAKLGLALLKRGLLETGVGARVRADRYGRFA